MRVLEKDVVAGIASLKLAYHFGRQVIVLIFRLPITVRQPEVVHQGTVNDNPPVLMDSSLNVQGLTSNQTAVHNLGAGIGTPIAPPPHALPQADQTDPTHYSNL